MRSASVLSSLLFLFLLSATTQTTKSNYPTPPEPLNKEDQASQSSPSIAQRIDLARVQKEADDLARTAQTIPADVVSVRKGMLPKDTIQKLKQIEKLSKRLRTELNP